MAHLCNHFVAYESYSKLKVLFHTPLAEMSARYDAHIEAVQALPGCQNYLIRTSENPQFHVIFFGVWDCRHSSLGYYGGQELQDLIKTLMKTGARTMEFEEIVVV